MGWLKTKARIGGEPLPVSVKTLGGKPVRLESQKLAMVGDPVDIDGRAFTVSKVKPLYERYVIHFKPSKKKAKPNGK